MLRRIKGARRGLPLESSPRIEELDNYVVKKIHSVRGNGSTNALLSIDGGRDCVLDTTQLFCILGSHFWHGGKCGEIEAN